MSDNTDRGVPILRLATALIAIIAVLLIVWLLNATYAVSMPLAFGFFLTMLMRPVFLWLNRRLPERLRWLALLLTMLALLAILAAGVTVVWAVLQLVVSASAQYVEEFQRHWTSLVSWAERHDVPVQESVRSPGMREEMVAFIGGLVKSLSSFLWLAVLIFFTVLLMLVEVRDWRAKVKSAFPPRLADTIQSAMEDIADRIQKYLVVRTVISAFTGVMMGLWLLVIGIEFALLWGLLAFILNYVPFIGSLVAVILPALMALVQLDLGWALLATGGMIAIQQGIAYYLDPRLEGRVLQLSPLLLMLSVLFWGWVWGPVGALLGVPMTVAIAVAAAHVPALRPVALLLSRSPEEGPLEAVKDRSLRPRPDNDDD